MNNILHIPLTFAFLMVWLYRGERKFYHFCTTFIDTGILTRVLFIHINNLPTPNVEF
jgi:hypothetical protein